jgi:hypothetical protein
VAAVGVLAKKGARSVPVRLRFWLGHDLGEPDLGLEPDRGRGVREAAFSRI